MIDFIRALRNLLYNLSVLEHHEHSRDRVYPQDVSATKTLTADATSNVFGSWAEIIPLNTIGFDYKVVGLVVESVDAATTYLVQLGFSTIDTDPVTAQIQGERRGKVVTVPLARATEILDIQSQDCPANAKLWGRIKTASANADSVEVSVVVNRHLEITNERPNLTTWPWT